MTVDADTLRTAKDAFREQLVEGLIPLIITGDKMLHRKLLTPKGMWGSYLDGWSFPRREAYMCMRLASPKWASSAPTAQAAEELYDSLATDEALRDLYSRREETGQEATVSDVRHLLFAIAELTPAEGLDDNGDRWWESDDQEGSA